MRVPPLPPPCSVVFVLNFMAGLLLDAVNALYICYAMDKDMRRVTHPEVHSMFAQVRTGVVVGVGVCPVTRETGWGSPLSACRRGQEQGEMEELGLLG